MMVLVIIFARGVQMNLHVIIVKMQSLMMEAAIMKEYMIVTAIV
jgi:hypothetical protein